MKEATARKKMVDLPSPRHPGGGGVVINLPPRGPTKGHGGGGGGWRDSVSEFPFPIEVTFWRSAFRRQTGLRGWVEVKLLLGHGITCRTGSIRLRVDEEGIWHCDESALSLPWELSDAWARVVADAVSTKYGEQALAAEPPEPVEAPTVGMPVEFDHEQHGPLHGAIVRAWVSSYPANEETGWPAVDIIWTDVRVDVKPGTLPRRTFKVNARRLRPYWGNAASA
jgi:hypothetical protein